MSSSRSKPGQSRKRLDDLRTLSPASLKRSRNAKRSVWNEIGVVRREYRADGHASRPKPRCRKH